MGTIGTYHYVDEECESFIDLTRRLAHALADEIEAQGMGYLLVFLETLRLAVIEVLEGRRAVWFSAAPVVRPGRGDGDGPRPTSGA